MVTSTEVPHQQQICFLTPFSRQKILQPCTLRTCTARASVMPPPPSRCWQASKSSQNSLQPSRRSPSSGVVFVSCGSDVRVQWGFASVAHTQVPLHGLRTGLTVAVPSVDV